MTSETNTNTPTPDGDRPTSGTGSENSFVPTRNILELAQLARTKNDAFAEKPRVCYADPPWPTGQRGSRGAAQHYDLMTVEQIKGMGDAVKEIMAEDSALLLWVTNNDLQAGLDVIAAWGDRYVTNAVWDKYYAGLGNAFRGAHELLLYGVRGKVTWKYHGQRSIFQFPRMEHSVKPFEMIPLIERVLDGPYLELFARRRPNSCSDWRVWGNEIDSDYTLALWGYPVPSDFDDQPVGDADAGPETEG
jgi:N6-adenosine-specific RNA methylase IME4